VRRFLYDQLNPTTATSCHEVDITLCPLFDGKISVFHSATTSFYAPSDICGASGMHRQVIRSSRSWRNGPARHDCVFVEHDATLPGLRGLYVAQVILLFSFTYQQVYYPCALVRWFDIIGDHPCSNTGMWMVEPEYNAQGDRLVSVIHLDTILRPAHLIPIYGAHYIDRDLRHTDSLVAFAAYYVNKYSDYHAYEIAF
jgi:hypothetical protein